MAKKFLIFCRIPGLMKFSPKILGLVKCSKTDSPTHNITYRCNVMMTMIASSLVLYYLFICTFIFIPSGAMFSHRQLEYLIQICQFRMTWQLEHTDVMVSHELESTCCKDQMSVL